MANKYQKQIKRVRNLLQTYKFTIDDLVNDPNISTHQALYTEYKSRLDKVEEGIEYSRNAGINENDLFKHRKKDNQKN